MDISNQIEKIRKNPAAEWGAHLPKLVVKQTKQTRILTATTDILYNFLFFWPLIRF